MNKPGCQFSPFDTLAEPAGMLVDTTFDFACEELRGLSVHTLAYLANLECIAQACPEIAAAIVHELRDQRENLKLIASENFSSVACQAAMANLLTDKYAEGVPKARYYAGCDNVDAIESYARALACRLFEADHAYVQPHSGADANLVAFWAILRARCEIPAVTERLNLSAGTKLVAADWQRLSDADWDQVRHLLGNQKILALDFFSGGHLTHGYRMNVSARMFQAHTYTVDRISGLLDYDQIYHKAQEIRPLILLAGYSAYSHNINFKEMRRIADRVGAVLMVDMAHFAGLVAGGVLTGEYNPIPYADLVTSTTHKTLRGPRGGLVLCRQEYKEHVDRGCPLVLGGPLPHVMAAKAVCFAEALQPDFRQYAHKIVENAQALASACRRSGVSVHTGCTENHLVLLDVRPLGLTGLQAESALRACNVTLNRNVLPYDPETPLITSGLRLGTAAVTTLGMGPLEMEEIGAVIGQVLSNVTPTTIKSGQRSKREAVIRPDVRQKAITQVRGVLKRFPLYPEIDLTLLERRFLKDGRVANSFES